jgi:hypothetical protein
MVFPCFHFLVISIVIGTCPHHKIRSPFLEAILAVDHDFSSSEYLPCPVGLEKLEFSMEDISAINSGVVPLGNRNLAQVTE